MEEVFLVVVIKKPTEKQKFEEGSVSTIVVQPTAVIAKDENQASMRAMRLVPEEHAVMEALLDVRVLPFRSVGK